MSIFNSLGSNYDFNFVLQSLFFPDKKNCSEELKSFLSKKYQGQAILTHKGREALTSALKILNLPKGSFVAINSFTCFAVYKAIDEAGCLAQLIDLEEGNLNFSPRSLKQALSQNPKIKVIVVQNTLGYPCDIEEIGKICKERNLILIEDLAHCVGTKYKDGREAGTVGNFITLSFSQDKIIDAVSGGALIIRNEHFNKKTIKQLNDIGNKQQSVDKFYPLFTFLIRKTYDFGLGKPIHFFLKTFNLLSKPMTDKFYAAYALPNWYCNLAFRAFSDLSKNLEHRRSIAEIYKNNLDKKILWKNIAENVSDSSNLRFPIFVKDRKKIINYLKENKIYISDIWYDSVSPDCKIAQSVSQKILNLPTHKNVSEKSALFICERINEWLKSQ